MKKIILSLIVAAAGALAYSQVGQDAGTDAKAARRQAEQTRRTSIMDAERNGVEVRVKDIARFRGVRSNQLQGIGLLVGLNGTGDTKNTPFTANLLANAMNEKTIVDPRQLKPKNVAVVFVTAELPAFAAPGNRIDITVTSAGDATSLQGGYLLRTPLYSAASNEIAYAVAMGPVSIGGFNAASGGSSVQKNHSTVGKLPEMGIVEKAVDTRMVFDGRMYLELNDQDFTSAQRLADAVAKQYPEYGPVALDGGTIQLTLPPGKLPVAALSEIESVRFFSDTAASVVISENTGTIVLGGNVRIGPAVVAKGSLTIRIDQELMVSQPAPFSQGQTVVVPQTQVDAQEDRAQVTMMGPTATVADLARIFQALKISATDMIAILEALRAQGALKARIKIQ
ncbi:MAG TPA: flagellar basal body P-ring protein FlgI [Fimbriimonadaceae bacterium]|nr:flagellar basal body P-ring protein FlgI [Fimbriimonadaceae bacterium]